MSRFGFDKPPKETLPRHQNPCSVQSNSYVKQLSGQADEPLSSFPDLTNLPTTPFSPNLATQPKSLSAAFNLNKPESDFSEFEDSERDNSSDSSHRGNVLEIENLHLTEQNRHLEKELLHCKLNVDSCKKVVQGKDVQLAQSSKERVQLSLRVKELEDIVTWFQSNVPTDVWEACPYSSTRNASSLSSFGSDGDSSCKAAPRSKKSDNTKEKTEGRKSDSYKFMRGLFKFTQSKSDTRSRESDDWVNCEDEDLDDSVHPDNLAPSPTSLFPNYSSFDLSKLQGPKRDSKKLLSSLRFYKQSPPTSVIDSPTLPTTPCSSSQPTSPVDSLSSRAQLRNHISSRPSVAETFSPNSAEFTITSDSLEDEEGAFDIDAELAALKPADFSKELELEENAFSGMVPSTLVSESLTSSSGPPSKDSNPLSSRSSSSLYEDVTKEPSTIPSQGSTESPPTSNSKPYHLTSPSSKEKILMKHLSISSEDLSQLTSRPLPDLPTTTISITNQSTTESLDDSSLSSSHDSSKINLDKLAQRPDRPLPNLPSMTAPNSASNSRSNSFTMSIKKIYPVRRRSSRRRSRSNTSNRVTIVTNSKSPSP